MKKIIFFFTLVLVTAMIYGYSQSGSNELAENHAGQTISNDLKVNSSESNVVLEYNKLQKANGNRPGILYILTADKSKPGWSSSFMKNYLYGNTNQAGC
jgi:hypothetical protein